MLCQLLVGVTIALLGLWVALLVSLILVRPKGPLLREALRVLPDTLRLLHRLATDPSMPRGVRIRLQLLFVYLALPIDLIPDFVPVLGYADDAILVCAVLRCVVRRAGPDALRRHWPGTPQGLDALWRIAGLPAAPIEKESS